MRTVTKKILIAFVVLSVLSSGYYLYKEFGMAIYTVHDFAKNPSMLNGAAIHGVDFPGMTLKSARLRDTIFKKTNLDGLHFEDIRFEDCLFEEVDIKKAKFIRVTFERCRFVNTHIKNSKFTDVLFKGGIFTYKGVYDDEYYGRTYITRSKMNNVTFDAVNFDNHMMESLSGTVTLKNINISKKEHVGPIIVGNDIMLRVDNCNLENVSCCAIFENSTLYATNSKLTRSSFGGEGKLFYIENCEIIGGIGGPELLIMKNCKYNGNIGGGGVAYLVNVDFTHRRSGSRSANIHGDAKSHMHIIGGKVPITAEFFKGSVSLYDVELNRSRFAGAITTLNMKNVRIRGGAWATLRLGGGQWENVEIYPTVILSDTTFGDLRVRNVAFPDGNPWKGNGENLKISKTPFVWPEIKIPTPEELGLKK
jgi:uncharacterized protein YjbI with pentapeptide repeats